MTYAQERDFLDDFYNSAYAAGGNTTAESFRAALEIPRTEGAYAFAEYFLIDAQRWVLHDILRPGGRRNVLDLGCGPGWFVGAAAAAGCEVAAADVATAAVEVVASHGIRTATIPPGNEPPRVDGTFDTVTMFEVVEHLADPVSYLRRVREMYPEATVYVSVPAPRGWTLAAGRTTEDFPPNHLTRWEGASLHALLRQAGFDSVSVKDDLRPTSREMACISAGWFVKGLVARMRERGKTATGSGVTATNAWTEGQSRTLPEEVRVRRRKRILFIPAAWTLRAAGRTSISIVAKASG